MIIILTWHDLDEGNAILQPIIFSHKGHLGWRESLQVLPCSGLAVAKLPCFDRTAMAVCDGYAIQPRKKKLGCANSIIKTNDALILGSTSCFKGMFQRIPCINFRRMDPSNLPSEHPKKPSGPLGRSLMLRSRGNHRARDNYVLWNI